MKLSPEAPNSQRYKTFAKTGLLLSVLSLLPSLFIYLIQFISAVMLDGFSQAQDYMLLLPIIMARLLMYTVVPLAGITALVFSILALVKSKSKVRSIAIAAIIIVIGAFGMTATILV